MSSQVDGVTRALKRLQALIRRPPSGARTVRTGRVPADLATEDFKLLCLESDEEQAYQEAQAVLLDDLRFEYHDERAAADALWRFICQCVADRSTDHVALFVTEHAREVQDLVCYLPGRAPGG